MKVKLEPKELNQLHLNLKDVGGESTPPNLKLRGIGAPQNIVQLQRKSRFFCMRHAYDFRYGIIVNYVVRKSGTGDGMTRTSGLHT